ncbi:MAG: ribosome silencing factor [Flavobacteriales bacterium]
MKHERSQVTSSELADAVIRGMQERKAERIVRIDLRGLSHAVCDIFLICHGNSDTQVEAIARSVEEQTKKEFNEGPWQIEGKENQEWLLLDYANVVAHIFYRETREHYDLEGLWADAPVEEIAYQS